MTENENKSDGISPHPRSQTHPNIPRRITHPDLPKGKEQVTMLCQRLLQTITLAPTYPQTHPNLPKGKEQVTTTPNWFQPPPSLKPILAFPKGRNKLLRQLSSAPT